MLGSEAELGWPAADAFRRSNMPRRKVTPVRTRAPASEPYGKLNVVTRNTDIWSRVTGLVGQYIVAVQPPVIPSATSW